ncbi:hypothetical protein MSIBF_A2890006 [groundwater metagenome]|uniref:Uncharacterized protein n=1 Tax=groundwater metagenome TaxID=717931 RepID=A0A098ECZ7_9ZZZZ
MLFINTNYVLGHYQIFRAGKNLWLDAITCCCDQNFNPIIEIGDNVDLSDNVHIGCTHRIKIGNNGILSKF